MAASKVFSGAISGKKHTLEKIRIIFPEIFYDPRIRCFLSEVCGALVLGGAPGQRGAYWADSGGGSRLGCLVKLGQGSREVPQSHAPPTPWAY